MASYLLKAPDPDMDRWRRAADTAGVSFAEWIRRRLDGHAAAPAAAAGDLAGPARPDPRPERKR